MNPAGEHKNTLIQLYLERADKSFADAVWLISENRYEIAAGRFYYACFYAIQALFLHDGVASKSHKGAQHVFLRDYVHTGKVDVTLGAWLSRMERLRELADYNCAYTISKEEVSSMLQPASDIIASIKKLIDCSLTFPSHVSEFE